MAVAKTECFDEDENKIANFAKALSHPARLSILSQLAENKSLTCGDMVLDLPQSQSTVSEHLKVLKDMGLICGKVDGRVTHYRINWKIFDEHRQLIGNWSNELGKPSPLWGD